MPDAPDTAPATAFPVEPTAAEPTAAQLPDPFLRLTAGDVSCPAPVFVEAAASVAEAARAMARAGATAALVKLPEGALGILTERDVLVRVVAAGEDAETLPVERVMSAPLVTVRPGDLLIEAFSRMVRHGVRRLVLLDGEGSPRGLLGEGDMLAARGESPLALAAEINTAADEPGLARAFGRLRRLAERSVAEGIGSEAVGRLISEMHDRIMSRAWGLALARMERERGPAPAAHSVCVLGSQARREQYLATDQDLALVFELMSGGAHLENRAGAAQWFAEFGAELTRILLGLGFPPCPRRIMLDNPDWRRSREAWLDLADAAAERPDADSVVTASLLSDLRPLPAPPGFARESGPDPELGARLRTELAARFRDGALLLKCIAREAARFAPPLGLFGGLSLKKDAGGRGSVDIKRGGVFPVTQGAKALALLHGLAETGTLERLDALARAGVLERPLAEGLREACSLLQTLRMRAQAKAIREGREPDNLVRPDELGRLEAERLRAAFKLVAELQGLLSTSFALHLLG